MGETDDRHFDRDLLDPMSTVALPGTNEIRSARPCSCRCWPACFFCVFKLTMGFAQMGFLVNFVSRTVVVGFTSVPRVADRRRASFKNFFGVLRCRRVFLIAQTLEYSIHGTPSDPRLGSHVDRCHHARPTALAHAPLFSAPFRT
jgi:hypothetical protein